MSVLSELQKQLDEIPETVLALLRQEGIEIAKEDEAAVLQHLAEAASSVPLNPDLEALIPFFQHEEKEEDRKESLESTIVAAEELQKESQDEFARRVDEAEPFREGDERPPVREEGLPVLEYDDAKEEEELERLAEEPPLETEIPEIVRETKEAEQDEEPGPRSHVSEESEPSIEKEIFEEIFEEPVNEIIELLKRIADAVEKLVGQEPGEFGEETSHQHAPLRESAERHNIGFVDPPDWGSTWRMMNEPRRRHKPADEDEDDSLE